MALDTEKAERKVWLVRVPPYVAKQWNEAIATAAQLPADMTEEAKLGHVTLLENGQPASLTVLGLDGSEQQLFMNANRDAADTAILSWEPAAGGAMQQPRLEGRVFRRFDAAPALIAGAHAVKMEPGSQPAAAAAAGQPPGKVDSSYLHSTRARLTASRQGGAGQRRVAVLEDAKEIARLAGGTKDTPLYVRNRQAKQAAAARAAAAAGEARKRVRLSRDELEDALLGLFAQQTHWHFTQIQKTLDQPITLLKEVLNEVALQQVRGPYKDQWELKAVYRASAAKERAAAAAAAAAAAGGGTAT